MPPSRSGSLCCVLGCSNNPKNSPGTKFYRFPTVSYKLEQKNRWIQALQRIKPDGSLWQPSPSSRLCSRHFVGNEKSDHPLNPNFVPTIFPVDIQRQSAPADCEIERYIQSCQEVEPLCKLEDHSATDIVFPEKMLKLEDCDERDQSVFIKTECSDVENDDIQVTGVENGATTSIKYEEVDIKDELEIGMEVDKSDSTSAGYCDSSGKDGSSQGRKLIGEPTLKRSREATTHSCGYVNCLNHNRKNTGVSYFAFPKDPVRAKEWQKNCGNKNLALLDPIQLRNKVICELHFPSIFINKHQKRKQLCRNAVPFDFWQIDSVASRNLLATNASKSNSTMEKKEVIVNASTTGVLQPVIRTYARTYGRKRLSSKPDSVVSDLKYLEPTYHLSGSSANSSGSPQPASSDRISKIVSPTNVTLKNKCTSQYKIRGKSSQTCRLKKKKLGTRAVLDKRLMGKSQYLKTFVNMQLFHRKGCDWTKDETRLAMSLYFKSPSTYKFMLYNLKFSLPSIRTIRSWLKVRNLKPGTSLSRKLCLKAKTMEAK